MRWMDLAIFDFISNRVARGARINADSSGGKRKLDVSGVGCTTLIT